MAAAEFADRVALVVGAGSGIGRAAAELLGERGATVVAADIDPDTAAETARGVARAGGRADGCRCDVALPEDGERAVALTRERFGRLDVVINCAGILRQSPLEHTNDKDWDEILRVNLNGAFFLTRAAMGAMRTLGGGAIVHIASRMAIRVKENHGAYAVSKAGVLQLTRAAALEGAPFGIRVNCVCPGFIDTPMTRAGYRVEDFEGWARVCPLGRAGRPEEVARAVLFLASDEASFITGVALPVDGGRTAL